MHKLGSYKRFYTELVNKVIKIYNEKNIKLHFLAPNLFPKNIVSPFLVLVKPFET